MATELEIETTPESAEGATHHVQRSLRRHAVLWVVAAAVLIGGALRFIPASVAAPTSSAGAGSTACAAK
jgi:hypothetical protein